MTRCKWLLACCLLTAALSYAPATWATDPARLLAEQGHFWLEREDHLRAAEAWNKLLLISPDHPEALYGLATVELKEGRLEAADEYLNQLKKIHPQHRLVSQLEQDLHLSFGAGKTLLEQAEQAVAESDMQAAADKYRQALSGRTPVGEVARDFYHRLGYTDEGLLEAIAGLRRLEAQSPDDPILQLALARHLARNEPTRLEAIERLRALASNYRVGSEANESWRDVLLWLGDPLPEYRPMYESYLAVNPHDEELRALADRSTRPVDRATGEDGHRLDPLRVRTDAAMKLIETGRARQARTEFKAVLAQRPDDSEALGGLGVLAMREGDWHEARRYLVKARRGNPAWQASLAIAQYWVDIEAARTLLHERKPLEAHALAERAVKSQPTEPAGREILAETLEALGDDARAIPLYREALEHRPDDLQLRYRLALLYQREGQITQARDLIKALEAAFPYDPEVLYTRALLEANERNWQDVALTLAKVPLDQRTTGMRQLRAKADAHVQLERARQLALQGERSQAMSILGEVRAAAGHDLEILNEVARAYVGLGESARGLALLGPLRIQGSERGVDASIAYIGLLLESGQDVEAGALLRHLQAQTLSSVQQQSVDDLNKTHVIRRAMSSIERDDMDTARDLIASVLGKDPDHVAGQQALAQLYLAVGQPDLALQIYQRLLEAGQDTANVRLGLAESALSQQDKRRARREADAAVQLTPASIDVLTRAARIHQALGRNEAAAKLLKRANALSLNAQVDQDNPQ